MHNARPILKPLEVQAGDPFAPSHSGSPANRAIARALRRLGPFLMLLYVVSFLDRANVSFAKQALATSRGITEPMYALGAGLFFVSYSLCGFPSNLILHRIGARIWLSFLMVSWGLVSMATLLVNGSTSFYLLRLLLGVTEAGFFPGVILYLTYWFPSHVRGRILGMFYLGIPLSLILGGPLSGALLEISSRGGMAGSMAVVLGLLSLLLLENRPSHAHWIPSDEKRALLELLAHEEHQRRANGPSQLLPMLRDVRVLYLVLIYALIQISTYGTIFYLPAQISELLHRPAGLLVGIVSALPWACALIAVYLLPRAADRYRNHRALAAWGLFAAGCAGLVYPFAGTIPALIALSIAVSGFIAIQPIFWTFPSGYLADRAAAGGIALIGTGNIGGFFAPNLKVWADQRFHSPHAGLYLLAGITILNSALIAALRPVRPRKSER